MTHASRYLHIELFKSCIDKIKTTAIFSGNNYDAIKMLISTIFATCSSEPDSFGQQTRNV